MLSPWLLRPFRHSPLVLPSNLMLAQYPPPYASVSSSAPPTSSPSSPTRPPCASSTSSKRATPLAPPASTAPTRPPSTPPPAYASPGSARPSTRERPSPLLVLAIELSMCSVGKSIDVPKRVWKVSRRGAGGGGSQFKGERGAVAASGLRREVVA